MAKVGPMTEREEALTMNRKMLAVGSGMAMILGASMAASGASATPPSSPAPAASESVVGVLEGPARARADGIKLKVRRDTAVRSVKLTYPVGSFSGWHQHPGIVIAVVESGTVQRKVGCKSETFKAGDAFTEVAPHFVRNVGKVPAVLRITQLYPASITDLSELREDRPAPTCRKK
ncbi:MAG: hypothetical protein QOF52_845 [Propionibacteriaceae bacterium]|jgi:hypothetical protein|nr:cupin 2 barrel protein [Propionibacteriaceae bacterium]MDX6320987.1 hypothetical protein [Propionibacteriaceae bacterium]